MPDRTRPPSIGQTAGPRVRNLRGFGVARVWRKVVLLQRGYSDLNRATGGAFGFNTAAKILGWAGVCAIVGLLLHKVHQIQAELDPVGRGLAQLQQQLQTANTSVASSTQASELELEALRTRAERLKASLDTASKAERDQSEPSLLKARREARDLADALAKEAGGLQEVAAARVALARSLTDYRDALVQGEQLQAAQAATLADGGVAAERALQGLAAAAAQTTSTLNGAVAGLQLEQLTQTVDTLRLRLAELQRQVDRASRQLAEAPPPQSEPLPRVVRKAGVKLAASPAIPAASRSGAVAGAGSE